MTKKLRMFDWIIAAILLLALIAYVAPHQLTVTIYKVSLVSLAACLGYWLDRSLSPYARPHDVLTKSYMLFAVTQVRRAIIIAACIIAVSVGL